MQSKPNSKGGGIQLGYASFRKDQEDSVRIYNVQFESKGIIVDTNRSITLDNGQVLTISDELTLYGIWEIARDFFGYKGTSQDIYGLRKRGYVQARSFTKANGRQGWLVAPEEAVRVLKALKDSKATKKDKGWTVTAPSAPEASKTVK